MVGELAGDQWNEGDVSCSVVRRVALPDAFFAIDGLFETFLTVLDEFGAFPAVIAARARPLPAVPGHHQGADGRGARRASAARPRTRRSRSTRSRSRSAMREQGADDNDLFDRLAADPRLGLDRGRARRAGRRPDRVHRRGAARRSRPSYAGSRRSWPPTRRPRPTRRRRSSESVRPSLIAATVGRSRPARRRRSTSSSRGWRGRRRGDDALPTYASGPSPSQTREDERQRRPARSCTGPRARSRSATSRQTHRPDGDADQRRPAGAATHHTGRPAMPHDHQQVDRPAASATHQRLPAVANTRHHGAAYSR